jgi:predicted DNA binding CopG/RHH family protein
VISVLGFSPSLRQAVTRAKLRAVTIRLATEDIDRARGLAARKGIGYQTYIKLLLREALQREAAKR